MYVCFFIATLALFSKFFWLWGRISFILSVFINVIVAIYHPFTYEEKGSLSFIRNIVLYVKNWEPESWISMYRWILVNSLLYNTVLILQYMYSTAPLQMWEVSSRWSFGAHLFSRGQWLSSSDFKTVLCGSPSASRSPGRSSPLASHRRCSFSAPSMYSHLLFFKRPYNLSDQ